jgi:hypothetical protein
MVRIATLLAAAAALLVCGVSACGLGLFGESGFAQQVRTVGDFNRIELRGATDVVVRHGWDGILTVRGGSNRVAEVVTRVVSGTLFVEGGGGRVTVIARTPSLAGVRVDGAGHVYAGSLAAGCCEASEARARRSSSCTGWPATQGSGPRRQSG